MFECQAIVDALNHNYKGTYQQFEDSIISSVENYMNILYSKYSISQYPVCEIINDLPNVGTAIGLKYVCFNKKYIRDLMDGDKLVLFAILHELSHIEHHIEQFIGVTCPYIVRQIKDKLLNIYECECKHKIGIGEKSYFYSINYDVLSIEIDADLNAIMLVINFFRTNDIDYTDISLALGKAFIDATAKQNKPRYVGYNPFFNSYYLPLDQAFDYAIKDNPDWLEDYPSLKVEYDIVNGEVSKKEKIVYLECNKEFMDLYHQCEGEIQLELGRKIMVKK